MTKMIMLFAILFFFMFGSLIAMKLFEFGLKLADKAVANSGMILTFPFKVTFKILKFAGKFLVKQLMKNKPSEYSVKPIYDVSPAELQHAKRHLLSRSNKRQPVVIEFTKPNDV